MSSMTNSTTVNGNIYIVTSPIVNAIKIGKSIHDAKHIRNRYITSFGDIITVFRFLSNNIDEHEVAVHKQLRAYNICLELFSPCCLNEAIRICESVCNSVAIRRDFRPEDCESDLQAFTDSRNLIAGSVMNFITVESEKTLKCGPSFEWIKVNLPTHREYSCSYRTRYLDACKITKTRPVSSQEMSKYVKTFGYELKHSKKNYWYKIT